MVPTFTRGGPDPLSSPHAPAIHTRSCKGNIAALGDDIPHGSRSSTMAITVRSNYRQAKGSHGGEWNSALALPAAILKRYSRRRGRPGQKTGNHGHGSPE